MDTAIFRGNDYGDRYLRQVATGPKNRANQQRRSSEILFTAPIGSSSFTNPGSYRQMIHPDLPYQVEAPLYVVFLALQDVTDEMGPTSFLLKTNTAKAIDIFDSGDMDVKDDQLVNADCRMATLKKGDAVVFDARVLHCGGANDQQNGSTRVMLNFSFRNPKVKGDMGYKGSMMPGYVGAMKLSDVSEALARYSEGELDPFSKYGNGLLRR